MSISNRVQPPLSSEQRAFFEAVENKYSLQVQEYVFAGKEVNLYDEKGNTPLHIAAERREYKAIVSCLIMGRADTQAKDRKGNTPLHIAANNLSIEACQILLGARAPVDSLNNKNKTPLMKCVKHHAEAGAPQIAKLLLANGANPNLVAPFYKMMRLQERGKLNLISSIFHTSLVILTKNCAEDLSTREPSPSTRYTMKLLLEAKADPNLQTSEGRSPLFEAVVRDSLDIASMLLEYGADATLPSPYNYTQGDSMTTPLHHVKSIEMLRILVEANGNINALSEQKNTPLHSVFMRLFRDLNHDDQMRWIRHFGDCGVDFSLKNGEGKTFQELADTDES